MFIGEDVTATLLWLLCTAEGVFSRTWMCLDHVAQRKLRVLEICASSRRENSDPPSLHAGLFADSLILQFLFSACSKPEELEMI